MNRILKRPMFRKGGSAGEGITSGLQRPGYSNGKTVEEIAAEIREQVGGYNPSRNLDDFKIDFGLDLVGRSPSGNIFQTAALAAKEPFKNFRSRRAAETDLNRQIGLQAFDIKEARDRAALGRQSAEKIAQIRAGEKDDPMKNVYLEYALSEFPDFNKTEIERVANYKLLFEEELKNKVGNNRVAGIMTFDPGSEKEMRKNVQKLKQQVGMIYYDPRDGKYKKVTSKNGVLGFEVFESINEIQFAKPDSGTATIEEKETIDVFSPEIEDASA